MVQGARMILGDPPRDLATSFFLPDSLTQGLKLDSSYSDSDFRTRCTDNMFHPACSLSSLSLNPNAS